MAYAAFVFALTFAAAQSAQSAQSRVHVVEGVHAARLANALANEPDLVVGTASSADVIVSLAPAGRAVVLVVREKSGSTALERRIDLDRGLDPAMRMAVLLVRGALEPAEQVAEEVALPAWQADLVQPSLLSAAPMIGVERARLVESSRALPWAVEASAAFASGDVLRADPALSVFAHARHGPFALGVGAVLGTGLHAERQSTTFTGAIVDTMFVADGAWTFAAIDGFSFAAFASPGVDALRFTVAANTPTFASPGTENSELKLALVLLLGGEARYRVTPSFGAELRVGLRLLPQRFELALPPLFASPEPVSPLKSEHLGLFLSAGVSLQIL